MFMIIYRQFLDVLGSFPFERVPPLFYISAAIAFASSLILWIWGNGFKWLYPIVVAVHALRLSFAYFDRLYSYFHHNHRVNCIREVENWSYFYIIVAMVLLGAIVGAITKHIINKNTTNQGADQ